MGPFGSYADLTSSYELLFASFSDRVLVQNVSLENDLIFMRMNEQVTLFATESKSQLGKGPFIHELAQRAFDCFSQILGLSRSRS